MPKRVTIYANDLQEYLNIVRVELSKHAKIVDNFANKLDPPYPLRSLKDAEESYHGASLAMVVQSCMQKFTNDLPVKDALIESLYTEYDNLPSRNSGVYGDSQPGIEDTTFTDDMLTLSNKIADYIEANNIKVKYLRRAGVTSDKITASIAIIYTGRELKTQKENENAESKTD